MSKPSREEIDEVLNKCADAANEGKTKWHGMSYEEGVRAGIEWVLGDVEENPMEDPEVP
jgi:hypothetical protein